jgi:hypothetical protein
MEFLYSVWFWSCAVVVAFYQLIGVVLLPISEELNKRNENKIRPPEQKEDLLTDIFNVQLWPWYLYRKHCPIESEMLIHYRRYIIFTVLAGCMILSILLGISHMLFERTAPSLISTVMGLIFTYLLLGVVVYYAFYIDEQEAEETFGYGPVALFGKLGFILSWPLEGYRELKVLTEYPNDNFR